MLNINDQSIWVGVIGSRNASQEELSTAYKLAKQLASKEYVVVSGLAIGVDTEAHKGVLDNGGYTIAIVNTPEDQPIYPKANQELAKRILSQGKILYPFAGRAREDKAEKPSHFVKRLLERDLLLAYLCPRIIAVSDNEIINGGTRYAIKYGIEFGKEAYRMDSKGKYYKNPKHEYCDIGWDMELDLESFKNKIFHE